jgi:hypothetical protein
MPHVIGAYGREVMGEVAVDEWTGASPIYTRRTQRLLGFTGDDIETLFKGLQLDIGAPPEFMDFRLRVIDAHHGEFWLDHCGALMDVEPMGDEFVRTMCQTIEDPTFDATAMATNPRARIRPVHRPPRTPADRHPHCHWTATIDPDLPELPEPEPATYLGTSTLAGLPVPGIDPNDDGWSDYRAPLDPDLRLEVFSRSALVGLAHEVAVQSQLLAMSFLLAIERRAGAEDARSIGRRQLSGIAGLTAERLRDALGLDTSLAALAQVLELHPLLRPRPWVDADVVLDEPGGWVEVRIRPCAAAAEEHTGWIRLLLDGHDEAVDVLARGVDPRYRAERVAPADGWIATWRICVGPEPAPESRDVALTRFSTGADFRFSETPVSVGRNGG